MNQLQMKVAVLEQEVKDKEQLMRRTREVLEAAQQQKARDTHIHTHAPHDGEDANRRNVIVRNLWRKVLKVKKFRLKSWNQQ